MIYLLSLITLLCIPSLHAASASASATAAPAANQNLGAAMLAAQAARVAQEEKHRNAELGANASAAAPTADAAIASAGDEPEMKVRIGGAASPMPANHAKPDEQEICWEKLDLAGMQEEYLRIVRKGSPRLVTSPDELLIHLDFVATTRLNSFEKDKPVVTPKDMYRIYKNLFRVITFPQDPTMLHTVQMALDRLKASDKICREKSSFLEPACCTLLCFLGANAQRRTGLWMKRQELSAKEWFDENQCSKGCDAITKDLYRQELQGGDEDRFRNSSKDQAPTDPALILEMVEAEVRSFLQRGTSCGYGDVYAMASKILKSIRLPKDMMAFAPVVWAIELCKTKSKGRPATPFSSLRALVLNHLHVVCCQEVVSKVEEGKLATSDFLTDIFALPCQLLPHLMPGDEKLSRTFLALNCKRALYDCYRARFDSMSKFLQGKPIIQGSKIVQLAGPVLDLAVAQDLTDIIVQYCTEPGWSIEYAEKMRKEGKCLGTLLDIDVGMLTNIAKLNQRGLNNLKGLELLPHITACSALEVRFNPLSELSLIPLLRCHQLGMTLHSLDLSKNNLVRIDVAPLSQIKTLLTLDLRDNDLVKIDGIRTLIPQLSGLDVSNNRLHGTYREVIKGCWAHHKNDKAALSMSPQRDAPDLTEQEMKDAMEQVLADVGPSIPRVLEAQWKKLQKKRGKAHPPSA